MAEAVEVVRMHVVLDPAIPVRPIDFDVAAYGQMISFGNCGRSHSTVG